MKTKILLIIKYILTLGLSFSVLSAAFDFYNGKDFQLLKFISSAVFFGLLMSFQLRKNVQNELTSSTK
ncbi:hypothetical protein [Flavobacterium sp. PL12]|uniref:hypothetical protein n=1 Tax=Flavobacterium sp. PL12 TaxID=3071718 RepID=UPI00319E056A